MEWKILETEYLVKHPPFFTARRDKCIRPDGVQIPAYYVVELPPAALTVGLTAEGKVLMVKQYRHPVSKVSLEFPGGFIEVGEDPLSAAQREMEEETGYRFEQYEYLGTVAANPGILNNFSHLFLAYGGRKTGEQQQDPQEDIHLELLTISELKDKLLQHEIIQSLHVNACMYALLKMGELQWK